MFTGASRDGDPLARHSLSARELKLLLTVESEGGPFLAFKGCEGALELFPLERGGERYTLGRSPEMDLSLPWDGEISGLHAELQCLGGEWALVDDGLSTNGTHVNGQRVGGRLRLRNGDLIRLGRTTLAYNAARDERVQATVSAGDLPLSQPLSDTQRRVLIALCRPYRDGATFATPASNQQIAAEVFLSVDAVKAHLRTLFAKLELVDLPQNQKRTRLAECALQFGLVSQRELD
jgi:pSer/pThr/pTyr-binding forkhead associated (FHA) protein